MESEKILKLAQSLNLTILEDLEDCIKSEDRFKFIDKQNYWYYLSYQNLKVVIRRDTKPAIFFNRNPYTYQNILNYLVLNNIAIELLTDKVCNAKEKLSFKCNLHGEFKKSWNEIKNGSYCPSCGICKNAIARRVDFNAIKEKFHKREYSMITNKYKNNEQLLEYICENHKDKGVQKISWRNFTSGKGCKYCGIDKRVKQQTKTHENFIKEVELIHGDKFIYKEKYKNTKTKLLMHCIDCDTDFMATPSHLLEGHLSCNCKSKSLGEDKIREFLYGNNIEFIEQYRIEECKNHRPLPFDFAIFDNENKLNYLIEYDGEQHFKPTQFGGISLEKAKTNLQDTKYRDKIKNNYCSNNDISLIRIPYWEKDNIEDILYKIIN